MPGFCGELSRLAQAVGSAPDLESVNSLFLRVRGDRSGQLWVNSVATSIDVMAKRPIGAGQAVFSADIADVIGVGFPAVGLLPTDGVLYLFR